MFIQMLFGFKEIEAGVLEDREKIEAASKLRFQIADAKKFFEKREKYFLSLLIEMLNISLTNGSYYD